MKVSTRRGRAIIKLRRQGRQVLNTVPWPNTATRQILWWEPSRYGKKPWGVS